MRQYSSRPVVCGARVSELSMIISNNWLAGNCGRLKYFINEELRRIDEKMRSKLRVGMMVTIILMMASAVVSGAETTPLVTVYKSPSCGCCRAWVSHMRSSGFKVEVFNVRDVTPYKRVNGVTPELMSCHTAIVDGYIVEGHVPAADVYRLLQQRPAVKGIAVPGMPVGSPGMEMGSRKDPYSVISFDEAGKTSIFARH